MLTKISHAVLTQVQVKPPKDSANPPIMRVIIEVEGIGGIEDLARYLGKDVRVVVQSEQMSFADLETGEIDEEGADADEADRVVATISRSTHVAQTR